MDTAPKILQSQSDILQAIRRHQPHLIRRSNYVGLTNEAAVVQAVSEERMAAKFIIVTRQASPNLHNNKVQITPNKQGRGLVLDVHQGAPNVLFEHGESFLGNIPLGVSETKKGTHSIKRNSKQAIAEVKFSQVLPDAALIFALVAEKTLRMASIGFIPMLASSFNVKQSIDEDSGDGIEQIWPPPVGLDFIQSLLLEWSIVSTGADQGAFRQALSRGHIHGEKLTPQFAMVCQSIGGPNEVQGVGWSPLQTAANRLMEGMDQVGPQLKFLQSVDALTLKEEELLERGKKHEATVAQLTGSGALPIVEGILVGDTDEKTFTFLGGVQGKFRSNSLVGFANQHFDPTLEHVPPAALEYDWVSRYLSCEVKELHNLTTHSPRLYMGSFLTGLRHAVADFYETDVRNIYGEAEHARECPPEYENVQLNSKTSDDFLTDGLQFLRHKELHKDRVVCKLRRTWSGMYVEIYTAHDKQELAERILSEAWEWVEENNFLKGEAFSLSGKFLERDSEGFDDVFLAKENKEPVVKLVQKLNDKGAAMRNRGMIMMGPPGCLHADTPIYDPVDGTTATVGDRQKANVPFHVVAMDNNNKPVVAIAGKPWKYEPSEMVKLTFQSGRSITVTEGHQFWVGSDQRRIDPDCFVSAGQLVRGIACGDSAVVLPSISLDVLRHQGFVASRPSSILGHIPSTRVLDAPSLLKRLASYRDRYSDDLYPCDGPLQLGASIDRAPLLRLTDALQRSHATLCVDDQDVVDNDNCRLPLPRLSNTRYSDQSGLPIGSLSECLTLLDSFGHGVCSSEVSEQLLPEISSHQHTIALLPDVCCRPSDKAFDSPDCVMGAPDYIQMDQIVEAQFVGEHPYFDFHVPGYENYWACGTFHHNTGKTLSGRRMMNQAKATFIWISARDLFAYGVSGGLEYGFDLAKTLAPSILFVEDIDNFLHERAIDLIKTEMDGIARTSGIATIFTTNYPERLPPALIDRPGRFDEILQFDLPDDVIRLQMLHRWLGGRIDQDVDGKTITKVVKKTSGYSGAHLRELCYVAIEDADENEESVAKCLLTALDKLEAQRELIDSVQLDGGTYRGNQFIGPIVETQVEEPVIDFTQVGQFIAGGLQKENEQDAVLSDEEARRASDMIVDLFKSKHDELVHSVAQVVDERTANLAGQITD